METSPKSGQQPVKWPFDLKIFATFAWLWSVCLVMSAFFHVDQITVVDPVRTIFAGVRFGGDDARFVLIIEAGIFAAMAIGIFARRRWGLLLALCYMAQVVLSHLAFVIAYLPVRAEWTNVRLIAAQGPMLVLITLYLWIRACDLVFDAPRPPSFEAGSVGSG